MSTSASPSEVRIEHSVADQAGLGRAFTVLYGALALGGLVAAALVAPELLLGALFFAGFVLWWAWRVRNAAAGAVPWVVSLTPAELRHTHAGGDVRITKPEATKVKVGERAGPRMRLHVLEVTGRDGEVLLSVSLPGRDEATLLEAALERWGWPVQA
jgi:hypothetical protein